jgi:DNA-binding CsgD family transcriptional regulator
MAVARFKSLTPREGEVVKLLLQGKSNKLIALSLGISRRTVEFHLKNVYAKFQVSSRVELILKLVNTTGDADLETLGYSTVESLGETMENEGRPDGQADWLTSVSYRLYGFGKELIMKVLMKSPSAFLPLAMSLAALATIAVFISLHGTAPQADEGTAAHIWQILMAAQVPIVFFFAIKWLPQSPKQAVPILALQVGAALAAMAPVFLLHW